MEENKIDFYLVPSKDPHGSEYLPDYYKEREFLTGFTGSQGTAVVTRDEAFLWTDGRYYIQAAREIKDFGFELKKQGQAGVLNYDEWIAENIKEGMTLGLNAEYFSHQEFSSISKKLKNKNIKIIDIDLIKDLWEDRYDFPSDDAFLLDIKYAGKSAEDKISEIREILKNKNAKMTVVSSLVDIGWTLNLRGMDIKDTPVLISFMIIEEDKVILFTDRSKTKNIEEELSKVLEIKDYSDFYEYLKTYNGEKIYLDPASINERIYKELCDKNEIIFGRNISEDLKAIKNEVEIKKS